MAENAGSLDLQPPAPVPQVTPDEALGAVKLTDEDKAKLNAQVGTFTDALLNSDVHGETFRERVDAITKMADEDIVRSAAISNRLLERPTNAMSRGGLAEGSRVSKGLLELRRQIETLDPSLQGDLFTPRKLLGIIPMGSKILDYFRGYESSQTQLNAIIESLYHGKDELQRDNASVDEEKQNMWQLVGRLEKWSYLAKQIDDDLSSKIDGITDPQRKKILQEEALFQLRQKRQDIATQMAVNVQGYLALDLVRRNNVELVKGVDRATTTTVSALRTAVIAAQALTNQKLVLNQVTALNETTSHLIESTSQMLRDNSAQIAQQAASSTVSIDSLKKAFDNVYATLDTIDNYKVQALDSMQQTITALEAQVDRAKPYLDRERQAIVAQSSAGASLSGDVEI
jgi:uncharacterized protein YaaN involved in tellurite resistance